MEGVIWRLPQSPSNHFTQRKRIETLVTVRRQENIDRRTEGMALGTPVKGESGRARAELLGWTLLAENITRFWSFRKGVSSHRSMGIRKKDLSIGGS